MSGRHADKSGLGDGDAIVATARREQEADPRPRRRGSVYGSMVSLCALFGLAVAIAGVAAWAQLTPHNIMQQLLAALWLLAGLLGVVIMTIAFAAVMLAERE